MISYPPVSDPVYAIFSSDYAIACLNISRIFSDRQNIVIFDKVGALVQFKKSSLLVKFNAIQKQFTFFKVILRLNCFVSILFYVILSYISRHANFLQYAFKTRINLE